MRGLASLWKKMTLRAKISLGYLPALIMIFAIIGAGYWVNRASLLRDSNRIMKLVVEHHSDRIEQLLDSQKQIFEQWILDDIYGLAIEFESLSEVEHVFAEMLSASPNFHLLTLTDLEGHVLAASVSPQWQYPTEPLRGRLLTDARDRVPQEEINAILSHDDLWQELDFPGEQVCFFPFTCRDSEGHPNGRFLAYLDWEAIQDEVLAGQEHLVKNGYQDASLMLLRSNSLTVLADSQEANRTLLSTFQGPYASWLQESQELEHSKRFNLNGDNRYCSFNRIDFPLANADGQIEGLQVLAILSEQDIFGAVRKQLAGAILVVVLVIPFLWALLWFITGRIVTPLLRLSHAAQQVGRGNLSSSIEVGSGGEMGSLECSFASMKRDLTDILADVKLAVQEIIAAGIHIQCASEQQALETRDQASAVSETAAAAAELSITSKSIGENVGHVTDMADRVLKGMDHIRFTTQETSELLSLLNDRSKQIVGIVGLIDTVADKTNMLAVNASIEAARAGEQGRGFAVVADQITRLARSTATSAKGISELIEEIQSKMSNAILTMERSVEGVEDGIELAQTSVETAQEISMSVNQQVMCSRQISDAMGSIDQAMGRINQDAENSTEIAKELTQVADRLQNVVARFQMSGEELPDLTLDR